MALSQPQLVELNSKMNQVFSLDEIESLCFDMGINFESLAGEGKGRRFVNSSSFAGVAAATRSWSLRCGRNGRRRVAGAAAPASSRRRRAAGTSTLLGPRRGRRHGKRDQLHRRPTTGRSTGSAITSASARQEDHHPLPGGQPQGHRSAAAGRGGAHHRRAAAAGAVSRPVQPGAAVGGAYGRHPGRHAALQARYRALLRPRQHRRRPDLRGCRGRGQAGQRRGAGALFEALEGVRCVVMNACWSATHATQIAKSVECVVGMSRSVSDAGGHQLRRRVLSQPGRREGIGTALTWARCRSCSMAVLRKKRHVYTPERK